jgi:hypothetical protein
LEDFGGGRFRALSRRTLLGPAPVSPPRHHLNTEGEQALGMRLSSPFTKVETFGIALAGAVVAWLSFVDPIWEAYLELAEGEWLSVAGIAVTVVTSLIGVACAVFTAFK